MALTLLIELPAAAFFRRVRRLEPSVPRLLVVAALGTLITHPVVWILVSDWLRPWSYWPRVAVAETFAVTVEALVYWRLAPLALPRAAVLALFVNMVSFGGGYLLKDAIFWLARALH